MSEEKYSDMFWYVGEKIAETRVTIDQDQYEKWITHNPMIPQDTLKDFPLLLTTFKQKYKNAARKRDNWRCQLGLVRVKQFTQGDKRFKVTRKQLLALHDLLHRWKMRVKVVCISEYIGCQCGEPAMFIGIEKDGYTHS